MVDVMKGGGGGGVREGAKDGCQGGGEGEGEGWGGDDRNQRAGLPERSIYKANRVKLEYKFLPGAPSCKGAYGYKHKHRLARLSHSSV